jgi:hypothetical protein
MAGVIQAARTLSGLDYGTREPVRQCKGMSTMGTPQRLETEVSFWDGLPRSSEEASVMGVERRGQVIQYHYNNQLARG